MSTNPTTYSPSQGLERRQQLQRRRKLLQGSDWNRADGRTFQECRPAFIRTGATTAAAGSAYVEFGATKVIVSIFGPRESKKAMMYSDIGHLNCNVSYTTFSIAVRRQGSDHKEYSTRLHKALEGAIILESFPKTTLIFLHWFWNLVVVHDAAEDILYWLPSSKGTYDVKSAYRLLMQGFAQISGDPNWFIFFSLQVPKLCWLFGWRLLTLSLPL